MAAGRAFAGAAANRRCLNEFIVDFWKPNYAQIDHYSAGMHGVFVVGIHGLSWLPSMAAESWFGHGQGFFGKKRYAERHAFLATGSTHQSAQPGSFPYDGGFDGK